MRILSVLAVVVPVLGLSAGCGHSGQVKAVVPIAGGGTIAVPMDKNGPPPGEAEGYRVQVAGLTPAEKQREAQYQFTLVSDKDPALQRIVVEDISDDRPLLLVDVKSPEFKDRTWTHKTDPLNADDPRLKWVYQITLSMRVYRFTLTAGDGHIITFNHVSVYPPFIKAAIRNKWGENY